MMTTDPFAAADAELLRLETAVAAIAANLVDLDTNPARQDLDKTRLTGETAVAWADATAALTQLWDGYRMLTELNTRARELRDRRRPSDADRAAYLHQVLGRSITLSVTTVPLAQRDLLGPGQVSTTCTPGELLTAMEEAFTTAVMVATRAGDAWQRLLPEAAEAAASVTHVRALIRQAGLPTTLIDEADRRLSDLTGRLTTDPLGVRSGDLATVRHLVARADAERTSADELRESLHRRLTDARRLLTEVAGAAQEAEAARDGVDGRFRDQDVAVVRGADLRADLAAVEALAAAGQWALISPRLAAWTRHARDLIATLRDAAARNTALLAGRGELRGRLDAYRAKALRHGLAEHESLGPLAETARTALFTAPCDLDAARKAVDAYQDALTATIARTGR